MVNPTKGTPTMPALASQDVAADDCNAFAGVQIPKWDPVFKTALLRKAKAEMPKTYLELVLLKEVLDSVNERMSAGRNSKGTLEIMTAALHAQFNRYEISWENSMGYVSENVFDEFVDLYLTIDEAVVKALATIRALSAALNAKIKRDGETKAAAVKTKFPAHNVKLSVERDVTPEAMMPDAKSPATGGSEVVMPDVESPAPGGSEVMTPDAESQAAGGSEVVTPDAGAHCAPVWHILAPAAGGSEVVTPDAGAHRVPDRHSSVPATGGSEVVMPDAGAHRVPVRHILAPAAGGSEVVTLDARISDAGTTDSRTSDTKMLDARAPLGEGTQGSPDIDHPNSSEGQGQLQRPPRPLEPGENSDGTHPSRAPLSNSWEPKRPPRPPEPGENSNGTHPSRAPISNGWEPQRPPRPPEPGENSNGTHPSRAPLSNGWKPRRPPRTPEPGESSDGTHPSRALLSNNCGVAKEPEAMAPDAVTPVARAPRVLLPDAGTSDPGKTDTGTSDAEIPDATGTSVSGEPKAMPPVTGGTEAELPDSGEPKAVLPESGEPKAMPPVAGENEAILPDSREPKAMSLIAGETQAMSPVVKPKPLPDSLTLSCKTPPQPATAPPQSSNVEKLKLPSPTLLIEQEPWDPPDMVVLSNKLPPQPATHGQPQPHRGRGACHRRLCLRRRHRQTLVRHRRHRRHRQHPQHWRCQPHSRRMSNLNADIAGTRKTSLPKLVPSTSLPTSAPLMPYGRPFRQHLHRHRRRDKLIAGMRKTSSPTSGSSMPYGWPFHQHLHRQAGNGSLPPSAPKTPPTYAQTTSHTRNGSLPPSEPKTPRCTFDVNCINCSSSPVQFCITITGLGGVV